MHEEFSWCGKCDMPKWYEKKKNSNNNKKHKSHQSYLIIVEQFFIQTITSAQSVAKSTHLYFDAWMNFNIKFIVELFFHSVSFVQGPAHIKRAPTEKLREVFQKYASQQKNGEYFMTSEDFIRNYLGFFPDATYNKVSI